MSEDEDKDDDDDSLAFRALLFFLSFCGALMGKMRVSAADPFL